MKLTNSGKTKNFIYVYLLFYIYWGFVFTRTIFINQFIVYVSFIFLFVAFLIKLIKQTTKLYRIAWLCLPYFLYTSFGYLFQFDFQRMSFWLIALFIIIIATKEGISDKINYRELYVFGLFAFAGIMFQFLFPQSYNNYISPLFLDNKSEVWVESGYGYNGFTYQLAASAEILVIAELVTIYLWERAGYSSKSWIKYLMAIVFIIGVFMTGKRTNSLIAILVPVMVFFIGNKGTVRGSGRRLLLLIVIVGAVVLFMNNIDFLSESVIFRRSANTVLSYESGNDFSSGRDVIWGKALQLFHDNPIFGIGLGNFVKYGEFGTDVHNVYLQCLCEQGIVGFVLYVIVILSCLRATIQGVRRATNSKTKALLKFSLALQFTYVIEGYTENMNVNLDGFLIYSIAIAIMLDCRYREKNELGDVILKTN